MRAYYLDLSTFIAAAVYKDFRGERIRIPVISGWIRIRISKKIESGTGFLRCQIRIRSYRTDSKSIHSSYLLTTAIVVLIFWFYWLWNWLFRIRLFILFDSRIRILSLSGVRSGFGSRFFRIRLDIIPDWGSIKQDFCFSIFCESSGFIYTLEIRKIQFSCLYPITLYINPDCHLNFFASPLCSLQVWLSDTVRYNWVRPNIGTIALSCTAASSCAPVAGGLPFFDITSTPLFLE